MKHLKYISIISIMALITAPAVADIASAEYVDNVVGTMTQSAINTALAGKQDKLPSGPNDGKKYSLIWNGSSFAFEEFTTGGGSTPIDWAAIGAFFAGTGSGIALYRSATDVCTGYEGGFYEGEWEDYVTYDELSGDDCDSSIFVDNKVLAPGDWYWGISSPISTEIRGRALCSSTNGTIGVAGDPDESGSGDTKYCWCKMTAPAASRWVFDDGTDNADDCANSCAFYCAYYVQDDSDFRSALFSAVGD